jgi:glycosyltransferase involved in cell wall biosynthesis
MKNICFVSNEIFPATKGGIGKLLFDTISRLDVNGTIKITLLLVVPQDQYQEFNDYANKNFKNTRVFSVDRILSNIDPVNDIPVWGFHFEEYYLSYRIFQALKVLLYTEGIDTIEFCDYLGLGFVTIKWKKLVGKEFENIFIQLRLHGSRELCEVSDNQVSYKKAQLVNYHMERYCLEYCDEWIVPSRSLAEYYLTYYEIRDKESKIAVPAFQKIGKGLTHQRKKKGTIRVLFYGKIQKLKGVDSFIKAALMVLEKTNEKIEFHIYGHSVAYNGSGSYEKQIKKQIPEHLSKYFSFKGRVNIKELESIAHQYTIAVIPSIFETFCLAAHELNWIGIPLIVNNIPGFSDYFNDKNSYKYNGTAKNLAETILHVIQSGTEFSKLEWNAAHVSRLSDEGINLYFDEKKLALNRLPSSPELVSVVIPYYNMQDYVEEAIESVKQNTYKQVEIIIVNDGSPDRKAKEKLEEVQKSMPDLIILNKENGGLGSARNFGIKHAKGEYVLCLDSDDILHKEFIELGVRSLQRNPSITAVNSYVNFFRDGESPIEYIDYVIPYDLIPELIFIENRAGVATSLVRKSIYNTIQYDEKLTSYEDWDFWWQCVKNGYKVEVIPKILFHYRRRADSMINTEGILKHIYHVHSMVENNKSWIGSYSTIIHKQLVTLTEELRLKNTSLQDEVNYIRRTGNMDSGESAEGRLEKIKEWYRKEYEELPLWYKRFGHLLKVLKGKRSLKSLFSKSEK